MGKTLTSFIGGLPKDFRKSGMTGAIEHAGLVAVDATRPARRPPDRPLGPSANKKEGPAEAGP